ncbi:MAG: RDD family protein [Bacilli bacterium]|nr:RDD family protein [Bacilli bacterium]
MKNNLIFKRVIAYILDILLVSLIGTALVKLSFINPRYDEYAKVSNEYNTALTDYAEQKISMEEYATKVNELSYDLNSTGYVYIIGDMIIALLYFGVFAYFTGGQTLGKKVMNLKIVSNKADKKLTIWNYCIRLVILNGIIPNILVLVAICFNRSTYNKIYTASSNLNLILEILIIVMIICNQGRGLHDCLASTKIIDTKNLVEELPEENKEEPVEVIKPKKGKKKDE